MKNESVALCERIRRGGHLGVRDMRGLEGLGDAEAALRPFILQKR
jgi:hypothetical protein